MIARMLFLVLFTAIVVHADLPSFVPKCDVTSKKWESCVLKATEIIKPYMAKGIPEMNIPAFNPLFLPDVALERKTAQTSYTCKFHNFTIYDLVNYKFNKIDHNLTNTEFNFRAYAKFERALVEATYILNSVFFKIPVKGSGKFNGILKNIEAVVEARHQIVKKNDDKRYLKITSVKTNLKFSKENTLNFDQLIFENPILSEATSRLFQDNNDLILEESSESIAQVISKIIREVSEKLFEGNTLKEILGVE